MHCTPTEYCRVCFVRIYLDTTVQIKSYCFRIRMAVALSGRVSNSQTCVHSLRCLRLSTTSLTHRRCAFINDLDTMFIDFVQPDVFLLSDTAAQQSCSIFICPDSSIWQQPKEGAKNDRRQINVHMSIDQCTLLLPLSCDN